MKQVKSILAVAIALLFTAGIAYAASSEANKPTQADINKSVEHQMKGNELDEQGKSGDAIAEYKQALTYDPADTNTLFNLGTVYLKINKPDEAAKTFEQVVKNDPKDVEAYNLLGLAYRGCGKKKEAINTWEKSLSIKPAQVEPKKFIEEAKEL